MSSVFEERAFEYDAWYEKNKGAYLSEIEAIRPHLTNGVSLEVGVGTGRFAAPLGITFGLDPAFQMLKLAQKRGLKVIKGVAEALPFKEESLDLILMVVTICFLKEPELALREAYRVLKPKGRIVLGFVDRDSFLGKLYLAKKEKSPFYREAKFYSVHEVLNMLEKTSFKPLLITQTIFRPLEEIKQVEPIKEGFGEGGFIVISAEKI